MTESGGTSRRADAEPTKPCRFYEKIFTKKMKKFCLSLLLCALPFAGATAQSEETSEKTYFEYDFSQGIGDGFSTYDRDGYTLYFTMVQSGFTQGDSWIQMKEEGTENYFAASTSKYKFAKGEEPKPSDDWLITPLVWVEGDNAVLSWRGMSVCTQADTQSGYEIRVSATGNKPEDFTDAPLCTVEADPANGWESHSVSLEPYKGQKIYVAFVNNNTNKEILAIDDIVMKGGRGLCDLTVNTPGVVYGVNEVKVSATLTANTDEAINDFTAYCTWNGKTFTKHITGISLKKGDNCEFTFDESMPAGSGDTVRYEVWAEVNGRTLMKQHRETVVMLFETHRKIVFEEGTGMWCVYCPMGIVAMDILQEKYPDTFIGLAIHYDDALALNDYVKGIGIPQFPAACINRKYVNTRPMVMVGKPGIYEYTSLSGGFETDFLKAAQEPAIANIYVNAKSVEGKVKVTVNTRFALETKGHTYNLAVVFVENGVTGDEYYQDNNYAGSDIPMGGFEKLPRRIKPFTFSHVVRSIYDDWKGIPGSMPKEIKLGEVYTYEYELDIPEAVQSLANSRVVAMLIDNTTGEIINADQATDLITGIGEAPASAASSFRCMQQGTDCVVTWQPDGTTPSEVALYDVKGALLWKSAFPASSDSFTQHIPLHGAVGPHIVTLKQGTHIRAQKVMFK